VFQFQAGFLLDCERHSGHAIEDIQINDIYIQHEGGATPEAAAMQPPEAADKYPELICSAKCLRMVSTSATRATFR